MDHQGGRRVAQTRRLLADCHSCCAGEWWSTSSWRNQVLRGRPLGLFQAGPGRSPPRALTLSLRAACAGVSSGSWQTWPKREWRRCEMVTQMSSRPVVSQIDSLETKSDQWTQSMRRWHLVLNAWSLRTSTTNSVHWMGRANCPKVKYQELLLLCFDSVSFYFKLN